MKRTRLPNQPPSTATRLWTRSEDARQLLKSACEAGTPESVDGVLLQHAMVADSVEKAEDGPERRRRFRISTETVDRHGDIVRSRGIQLKNYKKNPVVLFAHDARMPPIGTGMIQTGDGFVDADADFFDREVYDFADTIFRIVDAGGLKATSIGFMPIKFERLPDEDEKNPTPEWARGIDFQKVDLLEFSIVPIPANPEAVSRAFGDGAAMKPYTDWLEGIQDHWGDSDSLKPVLESLGIGQETVFEAYKAANGGRIVTKGVEFDSLITGLADNPEEDEVEETATEDKDTPVETEEGTDPPSETGDTEADKVESEYGPVVSTCHSVHGLRLTDVEGEFPPKARFAKALFDAPGYDGELSLSEDGNEITLNLASAKAVYTKVGEDELSILTELKSIEPRHSVSFAAAHGTKGYPVLPKDNAWNLEKELESGRAPVEAVAWMKGDAIGLLHHRVSEGNGVNFKAVVSSIACLFGAKGGMDIPDAEREGAFVHLADHIEKDFDLDPPDGSWLKDQPLKERPDLFFFDYNACQLLARHGSVFIDAGFLDKAAAFTDTGINFGGLEITEKDDPQTVGAVLGRKSAWGSSAEFVAWAKKQGFNTSNMLTTRTFWRLPQGEDGAVQQVERTISLYPNDVEPGSQDCKVQVELVRMAASEEPGEKEVVRAAAGEEALILPGDVVALVSGGPLMTVTMAWADGGLSCQWFDEQKVLQKGEFPVAAVTVLNMDEDDESDSPEINLTDGDTHKEIAALIVSSIKANAPALVTEALRKATGSVD